MKILVTGSNGQLGNELRSLSARLTGYSFTFTDFEELDVTNSAKVNAFISELEPDWIINCAAYTAVDKAELEPEKAILLNATAVGYLAKAANYKGCRLIQISTDYVFDGKNFRPYKINDKVNPKGVYASSKAQGEEIAAANNPKAIILRTSWLYSAYGNNFVKTIRRLGNERGTMKVIADQIGSPTWAANLAEAILKLISIDANPGIYHYTNEGVCSWFDFAKAIIELSQINAEVIPTDTEGFPLPAPRPYYSVLDKSKYAAISGQSVPYWRESLKKCIALLNEQS
ncbi:MAG: dTDP-4-dehydrorhamnose reductase [Lentimicrobium sp.]|nr:dTDP-4-dehydrorhamnose reductase [Lentimicrobium sp.]